MRSRKGNQCATDYFLAIGVVSVRAIVAQQVAEAEMNPPRGHFVIARLGGKVVGCGVLKRVDSETCEIKRVWTSHTARGMGVARAVMGELERLARANGFQRVRLDSNAKLTAAQALYRKLGYHEIARFNDDPYPTHWFGRKL